MSVFNGGRHLRAALESVLGQQGVDLEFVIIDDGSTDGSEDVLRRYEALDQRIRLTRVVNHGLTRALIEGCAMAQGEFIARQDADDISAPGRLACLLNLARADESLVMVSSWGREIGPDGEDLSVTTRSADPAEATEALLQRKIGPPAHGSVMFRRAAYESVGGYRPQFYFGQDSDLWLRMGTKGRIGYVQKPLYAYRKWPGNVSFFYRDFQRRFGELGQKCHQARLRGDSEGPYLEEAESLRKSFLESKGVLQSDRSRNGTGYYFLGASLEKRGDPRARTYFFQAVKNQPFSVRNWARWLRAELRDRLG